MSYKLAFGLAYFLVVLENQATEYEKSTEDSPTLPFEGQVLSQAPYVYSVQKPKHPRASTHTLVRGIISLL